MRFAEKILKLRKERGWSQEEMAEKLNVTRQAISRWEMGTAQPDLNNLLQLSRLFSVSTDDLVNDSYESDRDLPAVQESRRESNQTARKVAGICVAAVCALGNSVIYILSRFIEVLVPYYRWNEELGKAERWFGEITGYSYKYFVQEHHLELLVAAFWLLTVAGLVLICWDWSKFRRLRERCRKWWGRGWKEWKNRSGKKEAE